MGRGGTGKTSFVALMTKYFIEVDETPLFLIDADSDQNLGEMVGVDLTEARKRTISEILQDVLDEGGTLTGITPQERIEKKIWESCLYEGKLFDLIAIGTKWGEGCYCLPNDALKNIIPNIAKNYEYTLIDSPAGLEHLNRRISPEVNDIFDVLDPSKKSFEHVKRVQRIIKEIDIRYEKLYLVGGYEFPDNLGKRAEEETGLRYLGNIVYDHLVREYILEGKSLLDLPSSTPAYVSVKKIIEKAR